ncbi:MAG TPA: carboxypeptidase M32 [Terriglobales bacterium]|nr:carboxypeptidase M32 [Terriglobales bacterium]
MSTNPAVAEIVAKYKPIWAIDSASALLGWDMETYMPPGSSEPRGFTTGQLQLMKQELMMKLVDPVAKAEKTTGLNDFEKGFLRIMKHDLNYFTKIPPKLIEDLAKVGTEGTVVWREARKKSDFNMFKPYLEKMVELKRQEAEKLGYVGHPYNALMDRFEEGFTISDADKVFTPLAPSLKSILSKVLAAGKFPATHPLESVKYDEAAMIRVNQAILKLLDMPEKTFRMDVSTHPFTTGMAIDDVRITTRYEGEDFKASVYSTVHESGHAIYQLQADPALEYTPLANGASLGMHESQSRFWENIVGRSREFIKLLFPTLKGNLSFVAKYNEEDMYRYFNSVKPSLIRVEADELTYNFHIILRYELEKKMIGGDIEVSELPSVWNDMMERYVGIRPENDAQGVLQDVHWSGGLIGYFATYSLGNVIGGMFYNRIEQDMNLKDTIAKGELGKIKGWLKEHLHKYGAVYSPKEMQTRLFGEQYNPKWLVSYLEEKYLA